MALHYIIIIVVAHTQKHAFLFLGLDCTNWNYTSCLV